MIDVAIIQNRWSERDDDRFVDLIYDAALDDALWPAVLEGVAERAGAHPANILQINVVEGHGFGMAARTPEDTVARYFAEWATRNPLGLVEDAGDYRAGWTPRITHDREYLGRDQLERTAYFNEFLAPIGAYHMVTMRLALRGDDMTSIGLGRPRHLGAFEDADLARIRPFHRHLIRAERIGRSLGLRQAESDRFDTLLASSPEALFFLDEHFRLVHRTAAAEALLRSGGALRETGGRLRATQAAADTDLQRALATALAAGAPAPVTLPGPTVDASLSVSVARLGERGTVGVSHARCLMVAAHALVPTDPAGALRRRYGLTGAEAELALALAAGDSLRATADRRGVSINTVRNQLGAVFDKTGCRRQQDLVRLLTTRHD